MSRSSTQSEAVTPWHNRLSLMLGRKHLNPPGLRRERFVCVKAMKAPRPKLEGYEIEKLIGAGSYGLVYLAREQKSGQVCAVKEFPVGEQSVQHFFREMSVLFTLDHPNIIKCLNLIYGQGRKNHLIFEYAAGGSLREFIEAQAPVSAGMAREILRQITHGLAHAHRHNILHRDLKPENILLTESAGGTVYKIADLGIAHHLANTSEPQRANGSPAYMAPEQFYDAVTVAADFYSLGVIFYELLTGNRPFEGSPELLFAQHLKEEPDFGRISDSESERLARWLLAKDPQNRPGSATELLYRIDHWAGSDNPKPQFQGDASPAEPALNGLAGCTLRLLGLKPVLGSMRVFPFGKNGSRLMLADLGGTDLLEVSTSRLFPRWLNEGVIDVATDPTEEGWYCATGRHIYRFEPGALEARRLFPHQVKITGLGFHPGGRLLYTDGHRLYCATPTGRRLWQADCPNYLPRPPITLLQDGLTLVCSGPVDPAINAFDQDGATVFRIALEGPALACWGTSRPGAFGALVMGMGKAEPVKLVHFESTTRVAERVLGEGVYAAVVHRDFLTLFQSSNRVLLVSPEGDILFEMQLEGEPLAAVWLPHRALYGVLEQRTRQTFLKLFRLIPGTPQTQTLM